MGRIQRKRTFRRLRSRISEANSIPCSTRRARFCERGACGTTNEVTYVLVLDLGCSCRLLKSCLLGDPLEVFFCLAEQDCCIFRKSGYGFPSENATTQKSWSTFRF